MTVPVLPDGPISYVLCWYGHTAPALVEARIRMYVNGRAMEERTVAGIPADHPLPAQISDDSQIAGLDDASLQATADATKRTTWDQSDICALLTAALGYPVIFAPPPELVQREIDAKAEQAADASARAAVVLTPKQELAQLEIRVAELNAEILAGG